MIKSSFGGKWVARYKEKDGKECIGISLHYTGLSSLIGTILNNGGYEIVITDKTYRSRIIEDSMEISDEENPTLEHFD